MRSGVTVQLRAMTVALVGGGRQEMQRLSVTRRGKPEEMWVKSPSLKWTCCNMKESGDNSTSVGRLIMSLGLLIMVPLTGTGSQSVVTSTPSSRRSSAMTSSVDKQMVRKTPV